MVQECVRQGYDTYALVRDRTKVVDSEGGQALYAKSFQGATVVECDVSNVEQLKTVFQGQLAAQPNNNKDDTKSAAASTDLIVSCLASRSGVKKDAYAIDYQATLNCLQAGQATGARHFVLLSAFCVRNPWLQFQHAKLKFEAALQAQSDMTWTIVRPTAFFKSASGQLESVQNGSPYILFGDGTVTKCNPIAESDLATYLVDSAKDPSRCNQIINLGGPDEPITMRQQGEMIFRATGQAAYYVQTPLWLFDAIIDSLQWLADITGSVGLEDAAETARIGKYYAVEDMVTTDPKEKYGTITVQEHYQRIAVEGQEYDAVMRKGSVIRTVVGNVGRMVNSMLGRLPGKQQQESDVSAAAAVTAGAYNSTRI